MSFQQKKNKYDFRKEYPGPDGVHLSWITKYTLTRDESARVDGHNRSIKPRNWFKQKKQDQEAA